MTMAMQITTIPTRVTPRWFFMDHLSLKFPDAPQLVEIEPDEKRLPDDILVRHEAPYAAVRGVVAIVAHHEVVPRRHGADHALGIVVAIFVKREHPGERWKGCRSVGFLQNRV